MRRRVLLLFAAATLSAAPASADLITYNFAGEITLVDSALGIYMPGIDVGDAIHGIIRYDPLDPLGPTYVDSSFRLFVDAYVICGQFANQHPTPDMYRWSGALNLCQGTSTLLMDWLELTFTSIDPLTAPASLHFLGFDPSCTVFTGCTHTDRPGFDASISSVTLVPDTGSTALLLTVALGALVRMRRRHLL